MAFLIVLVVIFLYLVMPLDSGGSYLLSANRYVEWAGRFGLIVAPPVAVALAFRHWMMTGRVFLSLVTVSLGGMLTVATAAALVLGFLY